MVLPRQRSESDHELERLREESRLLCERLRRVTGALVATEAQLAETFEFLAGAGGAQADIHLLAAKRARAAVSECRAFSESLERRIAARSAG